MDAEANGKSKKVALTEDEIRLLVRVLRKRRNTLPGYLQSSRPEIELIDGILAKIS